MALNQDFVIQWYPGHMAKAKRQLTNDVRGTDFIIEVADARIPFSSRNPEFDHLAQHRPRLLVLSKIDLADPVHVKSWIRHIQKGGTEVIGASLLSHGDISTIRERIADFDKSDTSLAGNRARLDRIPGLSMPGAAGRILRGIVVGMPNTGKSTLIRALGGRGVQVGAKAGVTRQIRRIKVGDRTELLDTPGLMWPRAERGDVALKLAWFGCVSDAIYDSVEAALHWVEWAKTHDIGSFFERYDLDPSTDDGQRSAMDVLRDVSRKRGHLTAAGEHDIRRSAEMIIQDLRNGRFGPVMLDRVPDESP